MVVPGVLVDRVLLAVVMEDLVGVLVVNGVIKALQVLEEDIQVEQELIRMVLQEVVVLIILVLTKIIFQECVQVTV